jgi:deazaflavin-dependent oxidoreductase (nitroreductase family)
MSEMNDFNTQLIDEFRENQGRVGGPFKGARLLLLHHTGAKSGTERVSPLVYQAVGDRLAIFGSKGGDPKHPDWYHNVVAHPRVKVEVGNETIDVTARVAEGDERERIFTQQKKDYPPFVDYEKKTDREIPVIILERVT